jgi:hypothetical protein
VSSYFTPRLDILPASQRRLWPELRPALNLGLALYGGTAVALRIGHRVSVDFDFFSDMELNRNVLFAAMPFLNRSLVLQEQPNTLSVIVPDDQGNQGVNVWFFGDITFGRIAEPDLTEDGAVQVASLVDLMGTKLKVVLQRIEAKDYIDIAAMLRAGVRLE